MKAEEKTLSRIVLVSYPKIVFLYPTFVVSLSGSDLPELRPAASG